MDFIETKETHLSMDEQEVHINFNATDNYCELYTSYFVWIRKIKKKVESNPKEFKIVAETPYYIRVRFPVKYLHIRTKTRTLTDEQREQAAKRFEKYRKNKKQP